MRPTICGTTATIAHITEKGEEFYNMFNDEVHRHVRNNILPRLKSIEGMNLLELLAFSWTTSKATIAVFKQLFEHLTRWIEYVQKDKIPRTELKTLV